ncbi:MAG: serine/threonine protein kinase [Acidobacteria bacterium]|nr:serine/threonine protein kinase [Acidobacteriota bacterium]
MSAASPPSSRGTIVEGRYELGPVIGTGGMGEVCRARDLRLGREVAVKLLRRDLAAQPEARRRFAEEAMAAARLNHPNVVAVYDSGEHDGDPYIVMECLPGRTLADDMAGGAMLDVERVRSVALGVLGALGAAHQLGIVHRDVKPGNVLLAGDGTPKVGDFGIAKTTEGLDLTITGQLVGTPSYMAPERLAGAPATPASDLYAVGVLLYEALAGRKPFIGDTPLAVAHAITVGDPPALSELRPEVDGAFAAAVHRALARQPDDRFGAAHQMAAALAASRPDQTMVFSGPIVESDPPTLSIPVVTSAIGATRRSVRQRWSESAPESRRLVSVIGAVVAAAALLLVLTAGTGGGGTPAPATTAPSTTAAPPPTQPVPPALDDAIKHLGVLVRR